MTINDRLTIMMQSSIGTIVLALFALLLLLGVAYGVMVWRQRKRDLLAYLNRSHYEKAEQLASAFTFIGHHRADLFGRVSIVRAKENSYGLCTIPPPDALDEKGLLRFTAFMRSIHGRRLPLFAPYLWKHDDSMVIGIQGKIVQSDGSLPPTLQHYVDDKRLGKAYTEQILLSIASALGALHQKKTENGEKLYHGFLLPRSIFLKFDVNRVIKENTIADLGLAFTMGPQALYRRLEQLQKGELPIDKLIGNALIEQMAMLAPEQKEEARCKTVGPPADFYAFGALATLMFTKKAFRGKDSVSWDAIPEQWRPFLKACLSDDPSERPREFDELQDWLTHPDLALTVHHAAGHELTTADVDAAKSEVHDLKDLTSLLEKVQINKEEVGGTKSKEKVAKKRANPKIKSKFDQYRIKGLEALKNGQWQASHDALAKAYSIKETDAQVCISLAIALYELGDLTESERFFNEAKKQDPMTIRCFRDHIAFRV